MKKVIIFLFLMFASTVQAFEVGDYVTPKEGLESGVTGVVIAIYNHDGKESFGVEFDKDHFGLYKEEDLKYNNFGIHPIQDIEEKKNEI